MASKCVNSVDSINQTAALIYEKHHKRDIYTIAKEELKRINKERHLLSNETKRKRNTSAPANLYEGKLNRSSAACSAFVSQRNVKRTLPRSPQHLAPSTGSRLSQSLPLSSSKSRGKGSKHTIMDTGHSRSKSCEPPAGKSQVNRHIQEILNKIKFGSFASEWKTFSGAMSPVPKWVDFYDGENGGALDAFICKSLEDDKRQSCYFIDVRAGERVSRLLKYPQNIRVGQNGVVAEEKSRIDEAKQNEEAGEMKQRKHQPKERTIPLSWNEQLEWKNTKIITNVDTNPEAKKETMDAYHSHEMRSFQRNKESHNNPHQMTIDRLPNRNGYCLTNNRFRIQQKIPCSSKTREKCVAEYSLTRSEPRKNWMHINGGKSRNRVQTLGNNSVSGVFPENKINPRYSVSSQRTQRPIRKNGANHATYNIADNDVMKGLRRAESFTPRGISSDDARDAETPENSGISQKSAHASTCEPLTIGLHKKDNMDDETHVKHPDKSIDNSRNEEPERGVVVGQTQQQERKIQKRVSFQDESRKNRINVTTDELEAKHDDNLPNEITSIHNNHQDDSSTQKKDIVEKFPEMPPDTSDNPKEQLRRLRNSIQKSTELDTLELQKDLASLKANFNTLKAGQGENM